MLRRVERTYSSSMSIGPLLVERGLITEAKLTEALQEQRASGDRIDRVLVRLGMVTREQLMQAIGEQFQIPIIDIASVSVDPAVLASVPSKLVFKQRCVPIARENGTITIAASDPFDHAMVDEIRLMTGCSVSLTLADEDELHKFIRANYGVGGDTLDAMSAGLPGTEVKAEVAGDEIEQAQEASVIKLVNDVLSEAISERATDVHIEPYEHELIVRYRIDGVLQKANVPSTINRFGAAIVSRLKIMANLNIAEKRKPQDGRITFKHRDSNKTIQEFDLRVSVIPMLFGEGVVLRVLSKTAALMSLNDLGMPDSILKTWDTLIAKPHGILLVTGPTGSGKSTTLYASLNRIVSPAIKIITVEDPVEYHVSGVNQIQVNHKVGLDFASGLRSILRHDPDVVLIGEIRDKETAETAIQASLTGHLVFSTLHTNDAAGSTTRLLDMGVEPFLVSSSVEGIMAQRLVRRLCRECGKKHQPEKADLPEEFPYTPGVEIVKAVGCRACRNSGYRGRVGVYELLRVSDHVREMVMSRDNARAIAARARADGDLSLLIDDGFSKVLEGVTTIDEVVSAVAA